MTKYITGSKRLKLIQQYLAGHEDENYDVLPTKKEGKYIIKKRDQPLAKNNSSDNNNSSVNNEANNDNITTDNASSNENCNNSVTKEEPIIKPKVIPKQIPNITPQYNNFDPTVSIQILEQLKSLGDELRAEREAKHQKQLIKATVKHQMYKNSLKSDVVKQEPDYSSSSDEEVIQPIPPPRPVFTRKKINLLQK